MSSEFNSDFSENLEKIKNLNENNISTDVLEKVNEVSQLIYNNVLKEEVVSLALEQITQIELTNNSVEAIQEIINDPTVKDEETINSLVELTNEIKEEAIEKASEKIDAIVSLMDKLSITVNNDKKQEKISLEEPSLLMELLKKEFINKNCVVDLLVNLMDNTKSENIVFFRDLEVSYANIVKDGKINSNDIPELLNVINKIYSYFDDKLTNKKDLYILTQNLLFSSMRIYLELVSCPEPDDTFKTFKYIVLASINLIEKQTNKQQKRPFFYNFLCCK